MGRLIDAEVVKKRLAELRFKGELADYDTEIHNVFESVVDTTKTAFDVEKVVEQLNDRIQTLDGRSKTCMDAGDFAGSDRYSARMCELIKAIEVVRKGGIDET